MKIHFSMMIVMLLAVGCAEQPVSEQVVVVPIKRDGNKRGYKLLTKEPIDVLERLNSSSLNDEQDFQANWTNQVSAEPRTGHQVIELLEIACYADVTCHHLEYPLRFATFNFIEANRNQAEVVDALQWILKSYHCQIQSDDTDIENGYSLPSLVEVMDLRMVGYAKKLLKPKAE